MSYKKEAILMPIKEGKSVLKKIQNKMKKREQIRTPFGAII